MECDAHLGWLSVKNRDWPLQYPVLRAVGVTVTSKLFINEDLTTTRPQPVPPGNTHILRHFQCPPSRSRTASSCFLLELCKNRVESVPCILHRRHFPKTLRAQRYGHHFDKTALALVKNLIYFISYFIPRLTDSRCPNFQSTFRV
jgi:hypothetical protein